MREPYVYQKQDIFFVRYWNTEIITWIVKNTASYRFIPPPPKESHLRFTMQVQFKDDVDAMAFKLQWF